MPSASNRLVSVPTVSSAARMPLPGAIRACAVSSRLNGVVMGTSDDWRERSVPELHRGRVAVVAEDAEGRGIEHEALANRRREADPTGNEHAEEVTVREQRHVPAQLANARDHAVRARGHLLGHL